MKWDKLVLAILSILMTSCGNEKSSESTGRSEDITEIKNNARAYVEVYNNHDAEKVGSFWAANAVYAIPDTKETINGRKAIVDYFKKLFEGDDLPKIEVIVDHIEFKGGDKAIENGHVTFIYPDGSEDESAYQAENVKESGKWLLQSVQEVETGVVQSNHEHLKELEWLVGSWVDTDEDSDITLNFEWGKNKNFLIEHFVVKVLDQDEMEGTQIIGWDPVQQKIRAWVFDSDGGFREGSWSYDGDSWVAMMATTLADGKKGSSLDIYTKVNEDTFAFSMDSRDIDGDVLPDVGPVTFKKKK